MKTLYSSAEIARQVAIIAAAVPSLYDGTPPVLRPLIVLKGAFLFAADLLRELAGQVLIEEPYFVRARSYEGTDSTGMVKLDWMQDGLSPRGQDILIIEDIVDTGLTLATIVNLLEGIGARTINTVSLLDKPIRRAPEGTDPDLVGFTLQGPEFVVGYGLDLDGRYRYLNAVCEIDPKETA